MTPALVFRTSGPVEWLTLDSWKMPDQEMPLAPMVTFGRFTGVKGPGLIILIPLCSKW
jgi:hypothetical protein